MNILELHCCVDAERSADSYLRAISSNGQSHTTLACQGHTAYFFSLWISAPPTHTHTHTLALTQNTYTTHTHTCASLNSHKRVNVRYHLIATRSRMHTHSVSSCKHTLSHTWPSAADMDQASWWHSHMTGWCKLWPTVAGGLQILQIPPRASLWPSSLGSPGHFYCERAAQRSFNLTHQYTWVWLHGGFFLH